MTPQEIFDKAFAGIVAQGKPAFSLESGCEYVKEDGSRCAVGVLLDEETAKSWTGAHVGSIDDLMYDFRQYHSRMGEKGTTYKLTIPQWVIDNAELLESIQDAHDASARFTYVESPELWLENFVGRMKAVAKNYQLNLPEELEHV
jgi:hypothetical protein